MVPGEAFGTPGYFRLSYALGDEDLATGVTRMADLLARGPLSSASVAATRVSPLRGGGADGGGGLAEHGRPPNRAVMSTRTVPSSRRSATLPESSTSAPSSSLGTTTGRVNRTPYSTTRPGRRPLGDQPRSQGHGEHAVRDHVGQADLAGEPLVPVDRVEVQRGARVADQVGAGDPDVQRRQLVADGDVVARLHVIRSASGPRTTSWAAR